MNDKKLNKETIKVIKDAKKGKNIIGPFSTVEELRVALKK